MHGSRVATIWQQEPDSNEKTCYIDLHIISHPIAITETQMTGKEPTTWTDNGVFTELSDFLSL